MNARARLGSIVFWTSAVGLTVVGFIDLAGVGAPFFLTGVAMLAVGHWRRKPAVVWPVFMGVWLFIVVFVLVGPGGCTSTSGARPSSPGSPPSIGIEHVTCSNPLGIDYSGTGDYGPSLVPGVLSGVIAGLGGACAARRLLVRGSGARTPAG